MANYADITRNGLWDNNPALVQLLGLCPLLGVSNSVVNSIGLGLATIFVLVASNTFVSIIKNVTPSAIRLPTFVMIIAAAVTCIELLMQAYTYELYEILGIFLPLITTNCLILGRADGFACKNAVSASIYDGLMMGIGFALALYLLGAMRELIGTGALFANMDLLFGPAAVDWKITFSADYPQFLLAILPPGAFILTGLIIAGKNFIDYQIKQRQDARSEGVEKVSRRVRVTGKID
ncbi:MAG: electron transport complex subunit RsxE [Cellvibrionales bacterium]|nr:electron transport complex subunit RsxE [Cellvibrionales bacterium]|tara:strand:- start:12212 stop:12919 length:708 start_codon:yes stop_codon:yes gene_type:complete